MSEQDEIMEFFVIEGRELLEEAEPLLIELENTLSLSGEIDKETINTIFRHFHSLKGSAGFLNLQNINRLTHEAETLLDKVRTDELSISPEMTNILCEAIDLLNILIDKVESEQNDEHEDDNLIEQIVSHIKTFYSTEASKETSSEPVEEIVDEAVGLSSEEELDLDMLSIPVTDEMKKRYISESKDLLEDAESCLLNLEEEPEDMLNQAFRNIHSFKGNSGYMGYKDIVTLSHALESILDELKQKPENISKDIISTLMTLIDGLSIAVEDIEQGGEGKIESCESMISFLKELYGFKSLDKVVESSSKAATDDKKETSSENGGGSIYINPNAASKAKPPKKEVEKEVKKTKAETKAKTKAEADAAQEKINQIKSTQKVKKAKKSTAQKDIRVSLDKLDYLINLVGELVITESMVTNNPDLSGMELENFERSAHQLRRVTAELQDCAMSARMIPVSSTFRKMIRLVHDVANKTHKKVQLQINGEDTEVDKTVIEKIADPIVHILRNSIDHGIELPDDREAKGKDPIGTVTLDARHEGGEVWIIIKDDGKGLDRKMILEKSIEKGLVKGTGEELSDDEVFLLIFEPGFSTKLEVTDLSGRGVGMDVVKKNIEALNGRVVIKSQLHHGTTIQLRIPLTLAIIEGMLLRLGKTCYTLPILSIRETIKIQNEEIIITPDNQEVIKVRQELIPIVRLNKVFKIQNDSDNLSDGVLIIVFAKRDVFALFVDEILGQQQTVIKAMSKYFGNLRGISGCTILGTGKVSLILDIGAVIDKALEMQENQELVLS